MSKIADDLKLIEDFANKQQERCYADQISYDECICFEYEGIQIINPFLDISGRKRVNPIKYYGMHFITSDFVKLLKNMEIVTIALKQ